MRISRLTALFAVTAAHSALIYYFCLRAHSEETLEEPELEASLIFLEPQVLVPQPPSPAQKAPERARASRHMRAAVAAESPLAPVAASAPRIDWLDEAQSEAENAAKLQVESDDQIARQAGALRAPTRSPAGWSSRRPARPWVGWSERSRGVEMTHGALLWHFNEHCVVGIFIVLPGFGCVIGKIEPRADLFSHRHDGPMRYGDSKER